MPYSFVKIIQILIIYIYILLKNAQKIMKIKEKRLNFLFSLQVIMMELHLAINLQIYFRHMNSILHKLSLQHYLYKE